jgi:predicted phage terminase large subunit-like protein
MTPDQLRPYRNLPKADLAALDAWASTFYPFQRRWLFESADYAIGNKARQIGLSHTSGALGVLWGAFHGETTTIISKGALESKEVLEKARRHAYVLGRLGSRMARLKKDTNEQIDFDSGGRVLALPSSGGRGFTGNIVLDEFAYHEGTDDEKIWDAAMAVTSLGYRGRVISTPNGVDNKFFDVWQAAAAPEFGWVRHEIPIELAQAEGYPANLKKCWAIAAGNQTLFDQLYRCKFVDANSRFLFQALPATSRYKAGQFRRNEGARVSIGLDFAYAAKTSADHSAAVVLAEQDGKYYVLDVVRRQVDHREFRDLVLAKLAEHPDAYCCAYNAATEIGAIEFFRESEIPITGMLARVEKFQRAIPVATAWNQGDLLLPESAKWLDAFEGEAKSFTGKQGRKDDQVDALAAAFDGLRFAPQEIEQGHGSYQRAAW